MADALLSGLVSDLLGRLTSAAIQEYGLLRSLKDDLLTLRDDFSDIQAVLEDAEEKHTREKVVELWLKKLRSVSLKMENVLDEVSTEAMLQKLYKERGIKYRVRAFFSSDHNQLMFRTRIAHKVKAIRRKLADISAKRLELNLSPGTVTSPVDGGIGGGIPNRETNSLVHSSTVFGRDEEIKMVTEKICNTDKGKNEDTDIRVYAMWGMGGLGKTTLAQSVYNHERVKEHFDLKCWMYVSENFQVKELIRGIIESIDKHETIPSQLDEMQKCLQDKLRGKRFFVVLDDVWIENSEKDKWEDLSKTLSCGAEGSIVVMTTRSKATSRMMAKVPEMQHELGCLSKEDSWSLFKKFAFAEGREGGDITELEPIGKNIVDKCKGLPLAVKTLGGLMWSKSSTRDWQLVMGSNIWELQESNILPALKLSYDNLLPQVKRCFAYCCMLPKDHKMGKDLLILLWKANRLIPSRGEVDWYVTGEEIFNSLVWRSFIQFVDKEYKMHDLIHDLARYVMKHDCSIIEPGKELIVPDEVLHLSSSCLDFASLQPDLEKLKSLRSVFIFARAFDSIIDHVYLRVLYIDKTVYLSSLPESVCKLKHLKYLNLSRSLIEFLPESIIYLQNLQVLILNGCRKLKKLPEGMRYMRNLRYLDIDGCRSLRCLPVGIGKLTSLRRISRFPVGKNEGAQIGELGNLNLIGPNLNLRGLENVGGLREAQSANLKSKTHLLVLWLYFGTSQRQDNEETWAHDDEEEVLEGLEPNPSLEELRICYYGGKNISRWMVNLRSLVQIQFYFCYNCEHIPPLGKLPSLRIIRLEEMYFLKCFHDDDMSGDNILFPQLQELIIKDGLELINLPDNLPKLKVLDLWSCRKLVSLPEEIQRFRDLNTLKIYNCKNLSRRYAKDIGVDWPKISHIPHISIY